MKRTLYKELKLWKKSSTRLPLIVRGARQVGKSYLVEAFGRAEFESLHVINFEKSPRLGRCFDSLDPKKILQELELQTAMQVQPGNSLLFLDEIQDCPQALKALRYFAEEMPQLHVIAAGSLLEFVLEDESFSFPVGRIQMMNLGPLSFMEYLMACEQSALVNLLQTVESPEQISPGVHQRLLEFVREFLCIGGMPGIVSTFRSTQSFIEAQRRQATILDLYALDFGKYATRHADHRQLRNLLEKAPELAGKHFKYSKIDSECANPARDYREALIRLSQSRLILPVHLTQGNGLPLRAEKNDKKFKLFLLDVGLLVYSLGWDRINSSGAEGSSIFRGVVAEQFVAQELMGLQDPFIDRGIYYWENTSRSSSAEIDFLINLNQRMLPIEVKAGATGRLRSLKQFMETKNCPLGIRVSEMELGYEAKILSVPFYLLSQLHRLIDAVST